jgi:2-polyprenyl-3-methyl-5-hydroxy-6-metoxy-1,4-benzoquinol methylase
MTEARSTAKRIADEALSAGSPLSWFELLYSKAAAEGVSIPWANRKPNPNLIGLFDRIGHLRLGKRAISIGCGLGDDAEWLAQKGFDVTAFDISPSAIEECRRRFPSSNVSYVVMDLFHAPPQWAAAFNLVQESYTLQVLPPELRLPAMAKMAEFISPAGYLLFITRLREESDPRGTMPWPLTRSEVDRFEAMGLDRVCCEDYMDGENPLVRKFRSCYQKKAA